MFTETSLKDLQQEIFWTLHLFLHSCIIIVFHRCICSNVHTVNKNIYIEIIVYNNDATSLKTLVHWEEHQLWCNWGWVMTFPLGCFFALSSSRWSVTGPCIGGARAIISSMLHCTHTVQSQSFFHQYRECIRTLLWLSLQRSNYSEGNRIIYICMEHDCWS